MRGSPLLGQMGDVGDVIVVTGPPGAGKSTVAALLADRVTPSALVCGDDFYGFLRKGAVAPWLPEAQSQNTAVTEAAAAAAGRMARYCHVVYDGVIGPWFLPTFVDTSTLERVHYAVLLPPLDVCLRRVRVRTGHGFTDSSPPNTCGHDFHHAASRPAARAAARSPPPAELADRVIERAQAATIAVARARPPLSVRHAELTVEDQVGEGRSAPRSVAPRAETADPRHVRPGRSGPSSRRSCRPTPRCPRWA